MRSTIYILKSQEERQDGELPEGEGVGVYFNLFFVFFSDWDSSGGEEDVSISRPVYIAKLATLSKIITILKR